MEEQKACALLKSRFEAAGFRIAENVFFEEGGVKLDLDGFDAGARVGYEYVTEEAGDGWDVDDAVKKTLAERMRKGEVHILIVDEGDAPDAASLTKLADAFLAKVKPAAAGAAKKPAAPVAASSASSKKPPPTPPKKPAGKKPAKK
jgi:hypothetical protein